MYGVTEEVQHLYCLDGDLALPNHVEYMSRDIVDIFDKLTPTQIKPRLSGGVEFISGYDIPSGLRGIYMIYYEHPISGIGSIYVGSSIYGVRKRISEFVRFVMHGEEGIRDRDSAPSRKWRKSYGRSVDYAYVKFIKMSEDQNTLRELEKGVIYLLREKLGRDMVLNENDPTITLETKHLKTQPSGVLDFG